MAFLVNLHEDFFLSWILLAFVIHGLYPLLSVMPFLIGQQSLYDIYDICKIPLLLFNSEYCLYSLSLLNLIAFLALFAIYYVVVPKIMKYGIPNLL